MQATDPGQGAERSDDEEDEFHLWANSFRYCHDLNGRLQLLDCDGTQIMMEWEMEYMERCVDRLDIDGDCHVLEIGFGCAYSANRIQDKCPRSHTIIEMSKPVLQRLHKWAADRTNVEIVEGTWQERLPELGQFDRLFFDDYGSEVWEKAPAAPELPERYRQEYARGESHFTGLLGVLLRWHSRPAARLTGYCASQAQVDRHDVEVSYERMAVDAPPNCRYFYGKSLVVPLFTEKEVGDGSDSGSSAVISE